MSTAEHAHAADRFEREIVGILTASVMRSRRLMRNPFGGGGTGLMSRSTDEQVAELSALIEARYSPLASVYGRTLYDLDPEADPEEAEYERPPILLHPPANETAIVEAEKQLKFALPPLLKAVYAGIGNGGWCLRIMGVKGGQMGFDDIGFRRKTIVPARRQMVRVWPEVFGKPWPDRLVPISDASGCGMVEHVDCSSDEGRVWRTDSGYLTELHLSLWEYFVQALAPDAELGAAADGGA